MREPHPAVEPGAAAETADHRDLDRRNDGRAGDRPGIGEIEKRLAGIFQALGFIDQPRRRFGAGLRLRRILRAIGNAEFGRGLRRQDALPEQKNERHQSEPGDCRDGHGDGHTLELETRRERARNNRLGQHACLVLLILVTMGMPVLVITVMILVVVVVMMMIVMVVRVPVIGV